MEANWMALMLSIVKNKSVDESLENMKIKPKRIQKQKLELYDSDFELIFFLKKTHTWYELAKEFGVTANYMNQLCFRYKNKKAIEGAPTKVSPSICLTKKSISL